MSKLDRDRAQARYKAQQKQNQGPARALTEAQEHEKQIADKTARLRALRLARDVAEPERQDPTKSTPAKKTKPATAKKRGLAPGRIVAQTTDSALKYEQIIRQRDEHERDYARHLDPKAKGR